MDITYNSDKKNNRNSTVFKEHVSRRAAENESFVVKQEHSIRELHFNTCERKLQDCDVFLVTLNNKKIIKYFIKRINIINVKI